MCLLPKMQNMVDSIKHDSTKMQKMRCAISTAVELKGETDVLYTQADIHDKPEQP